MTTSRSPAVGTDWLRAQTKRITEGPQLPVSQAVGSSVQVERWLQHHEVAYAPATMIPMHLIDVKRSRANQARKDAIVPDSVERFASAMKADSVFPPIVVYPIGGRVVIIDGNNRHAGAVKAGKDTIWGIVIDDQTPSELIQLLTVEANASHGVTPELSWRIQQAFHLLSLGFSDATAASACSVTVAQLQVARRVQESDSRARSLKIAGFVDLPVSTRAALSVLRDEPVFLHAARVAIATRMTTEEVRDLLRAVKKESSEAAKIEAIAKISEMRTPVANTKKLLSKTPRVSNPKTSLTAGVGMLLNVDVTSLVRNIRTRPDRDLIADRLRLMETKLLELMIAVDKLNDFDEPDEEDA